MSEGSGVVESGGMAAAMPAGDSAGEESSSVNWNDVALEFDSGDSGDSDGTVEGDLEVVGGSPNSAEPPPAPADSVVAPATSAAGEPPLPATAPAVPVTPIPPVIPPVSQEQTQGPPATQDTGYATWREGQLGVLEKQFGLDEEMSRQLLTEPEIVLPKLAARISLDTAEQVMKAVYAAMPQWVNQVTVAQTQRVEAEKLFYGANPDLTDPNLKPAILQFAQQFRQVNPSAPPDLAVKAIGRMVRSAFNLPEPGQAPASPTPTAAPVFTPARGGGGTASQGPVSNNPWAALAEEFLTE